MGWRWNIMGFWIGEWLHEIPDTEYDKKGRQAIVKHLCIGPLETQIWYKLENGQYCYEINFIEGLESGELYMEFLSKFQMIEVIESEIALCEKYNKTELAALFQVEKEKILLS